MGLGLIPAAAARALGQLGDRRFLRVLALGLGLTVALLAAVSAAVLWLVGRLVPDDGLRVLGLQIGWAEPALTLGSGLALVALSAVLMVPVASAFTGVFLDTVADAVEARHYPRLGPAPTPPLGVQLVDSVGFLALMLGVNLAALVLYLASGPLAPLVFWAVNGALLGREYFQLTALRRLGRAGARAARRRHRLTIFAAGTLMAVPLSVPVVNLLVPILGAATFTHLFHALEPQGGR